MSQGVTRVVRKFFIPETHFSLETIPGDVEVREISQNYLKPLPGMVRRIRRASRGGASRYSYLEWHAAVADQGETLFETDITGDQYKERLMDSDWNRDTIRMTRYTFRVGKYRCDIDVHHVPIPWLRTPKVALGENPLDVSALLPAWKLRDVTNDPQFSNYTIAGGSLISNRPIAA